MTFEKDLTKWIGDKYPQENEEPTWIPTKEVAKRFGLHPQTIRDHKNNHPELIDGTDYILSMMKIDGVKRKVLLWSKSGINKLSKIIRSDEAKEHRELTTIDPERISKLIFNILKEELQPIRKLVQDQDQLSQEVQELKNNLASPVTYSQLTKILADKRLELKKKGYEWHEVHKIAKGWTGLSQYSHMNIGQIEEGIRRLDEILNNQSKSQ